ncbi:DUF1642 domain-containing protein [Streptococcus suis]|uniref:DUF1642 domain-containing protein n=1 Tax=Streptococcus suis TaxID=1307 RepID=UPI000B074FC3|nr:DUF1642 domain-containing protein [Streptococcus suis]MDW8650082.1 DUF1642 domain-containing protein [Streptococcus suis]HEL2442084.1 DUF1642 domain-containing protein [Streptococcus suis]HEM4064095.1 DUF1642 domain-containing protein [Streptococcus suis]
MNKQEATKQVEQMGEYEHFVDELISKKLVLNIISQIHEPQKVVVPKIVALRIEKYKDSNKSLYQLLDLSDDKEFNDWFLPSGEVDASRCDVLARAWLDGYEIEQEKLYTVEIPNPNANGYSRLYLSKDAVGKVQIYIFQGYTSTEFADNWKKEQNAQLTEAEIKQDFEWAWQWAKPVEDN